MTLITTADIDLGTRFGGSVDVPFEITHVENDLQMALGRIRGTAIIDTEYTERIDAETHWRYHFLVDGTNQRVMLERLEFPDGADFGAQTDRERLDTEPVEPGSVVEEYERALAQLLRRTKETETGGLTTTQGDAILSAVFDKYGAYPDQEIKNTDIGPFESYTDIEEHFTRDETRRLWRKLTEIEQIGKASASNCILRSRATAPEDLREYLDDEEWNQFRSELDADS